MNKIVIMCIGTMKVMGDSVGPRVGAILKGMGIDATILGCEQEQITMLNMSEYTTLLNKNYSDCIKIIVDSTLGISHKVGKIVINKNGIKPAGAFNEQSPTIGDIGIMAVVGDAQKNRINELKSVSENFVVTLAEKTASLIKNSIEKFLFASDLQENLIRV